MSITFIYQKVNKAKHILEEQFEFTNSAALRAYLKLQVRYYLENDDEREELFTTFLNCTYEDQHCAAINELAKGEEVITPYTFDTNNHIFVLNLILKRDMIAS